MGMPVASTHASPEHACAACVRSRRDACTVDVGLRCGRVGAALQHQNSFDVCWCRGSVAEKIFAPLMDRIRARGGRVTGSRLVERLDVNDEGLVHKVMARYAPGPSPSRGTARGTARTPAATSRA